MALKFKEMGHDVHIFTSHPYYPTGKLTTSDWFKFKHNTYINSIPVKRHWLIPSQKNNPLLRLISMFTMFISMFTSLSFLKEKKFDTVIVQTPPISLPLLGVIAKKRFGIKLILNVSDLWPEAMVNLKSIKRDSFAYRILHKLEKYYYKNADMILTQSEESKEYINSIGFNTSMVYRIGADLKRFTPSEIKSNSSTSFNLVYMGVLGVAHGILDLIKEVDFESINTILHIYGNGVEYTQIDRYIKAKKLSNVVLHSTVPYTEVHNILGKHDAAIISQKNYVKGTLPAKLYESMSMGIPILFHGDGEGADIVKKHTCGLTSLPTNYSLLKENIKRLSKNSIDREKMGKNGRTACLQFYDRDKQFQILEDQLQKLYSNC
ncbi:glycosyltransferase WbuB [Flammeovirga pectinis]|uniref:Glycosyltransferase WbuB n=2 Tax=Flammeovirga pectinis TaxID=2494373 RepID=A0A3S9P0R3_9BACT|nr:glycosyltransferase WbuB [Flammeovirga pectinis]